jgi:predicted RNA binding protein YcfA (HicA-like mRNA interferase family)
MQQPLHYPQTKQYPDSKDIGGVEEGQRGHTKFHQGKSVDVVVPMKPGPMLGPGNYHQW